MKKKILRRSMALGALMAFVITGSAMAATPVVAQSSNESINITGAHDIGIYNGSGTTMDFTGETINIDTTPGSSWGSGNVGVWAKENSTGTSIINLGEKGKTKRISINVLDNSGKADVAVGLWAHGQPDMTGGRINVNAEELKITGHSTGGWVYGIYTQNCTTKDTEDKLAKININAENIYVNITSDVEGRANGIVAMSQGKLAINGNLEVNAENAIVARGDAEVKINEANDKTVKLNGDIDFNYDKATSGTKVDADVLVNLSGAESYWNGNAKVSWGTGTITPEEKAEVTGLELGISNGAQWNPTPVEDGDMQADSGTSSLSINSVKMDDGIINLEKMGAQVLNVENMSGEGTVNTASLDNKIKITDAEKVEALTVQGNSAIADQIASGDASLQELADVVSTGSGEAEKSAATSVATPESLVAGAVTAEVDENGNIITSSIKEEVNEKNNGITEAGVNLKAHWRAHMNDMNKRLGELRSAGGEHGIWVRMNRGEASYKGNKAQYNQYQLGYDEKLSSDKSWTVGAAVTFAEGDSSFSTGSTEDKSTAFAVYGSKLNKDGSFIDLIGRYAHMKSDVTDVTGKGDYKTNGYSVSAEYGKRFTGDNGFWLEPQAELTYGTVDKAVFELGGRTVEMGDMDSLIGRLGFAVGKDIKAGNVYARASYLYDFDGETDATYSAGGVTRTIADDLGGGWWEIGAGANINLSKATYIYADVEKTFGGELNTDWQWNLGVRYSF